MIGGNGTAAVLALGAGLAGSMQVAVMGRFGDRIGSLEALTFSLGLSTVVACLVLAVARRGTSGLGDALTSPKWLWLGGVLGAFVVFTITVVGPQLGTTATIALLIAGQLAMGALIDRFGWFGVEQVALGWPRLVGIALLAVGAALTLKQ